ncbi:hypothetical protein V6N13_001446 [Hibiscus sabdariffa]
MRITPLITQNLRYSYSQQPVIPNSLSIARINNSIWGTRSFQNCRKTQISLEEPLDDQENLLQIWQALKAIAILGTMPLHRDPEHVTACYTNAVSCQALHRASCCCIAPASSLLMRHALHQRFTC